MGIAIFLLVVIILVILGIMIRNNIVRHHNATIRAWADVTSFERQKLKTLEELAPVVEQYAGMEKGEPYRVCRRLNILRDYSDEKTKLYPRN